MRKTALNALVALVIAGSTGQAAAAFTCVNFTIRQWSIETLVHIAGPTIIGTGRTMPPRMALALVEGRVAEARGSIPATSIPLEASCLDEAQRRRKSCLLHATNPPINSIQSGLHAQESVLAISHFTNLDGRSRESSRRARSARRKRSRRVFGQHSLPQLCPVRTDCGSWHKCVRKGRF